MAKAKEEAAVTAEKKEGYVQVFVPKEYPHQEDAKVRVNGRGWLVKRGVFVDVPKEVAEVLQHSQELKEEQNAYLEKISADGNIGEL